ncbi:hypothetical protein EB796_012344 [Bugula neritina]|uniref:Uncharacterized protein n=1 Tax=Bugula neritina TaxID=10212 RepID=A0A7J7JSL5_BUGNE|nr:hypothetical protein EB796_012344 [Bugula neritina]
MLWWSRHQASCGGKYIKISEPEEFTKKQQVKQSKIEAKRKKEDAKNKSKITNFFPTSPAQKGNSVPPCNKTQSNNITPTTKITSSGNTTPSNNIGSRLGGNSSISKVMTVRRIPGIGEIPVRVEQQSSLSTASPFTSQSRVNSFTLPQSKRTKSTVKPPARVRLEL